MIHARRFIVASIASLACAVSHAHAQWSISGSKVTYTGGNVGIGNANPNDRLDVRTSGTRAIHAYATANEGNTVGVYAVSRSLTGKGVYGFANSFNGPNYGVYGETASDEGYAGYFVGGRNYFQGQVGIGTTSPQATLDVVGDMMVRDPVFSQFGDVTNLFIGDSANRISNTYGTGLQIAAYPGDNSDLTIRSGTGNVGIGTDTPSQKLDVIGNIRCVALIETSSRDLKKDIAPLAGALDSIMRLQGVSYAWNDRAPECVKGKRDIGFIADEVNAVLPDIVAKDENGKPVGIDYGKITSVAVEAIKQLKAENDQIKSDNADLKARLGRLEALVAVQAANDSK